MKNTRRNFIKKTLLISAATWLVPKLSWAADLFSATSLEKTLSTLTGDKTIESSDKIKFIRLPTIAENGAVVPITITTTLTAVETIAIIVAKNPIPLAAQFTLSPKLLPKVSARLKMAKTSEVIALVKADNQYYMTKQTVKVTIGGCGG